MVSPKAIFGFIPVLSLAISFAASGARAAQETDRRFAFLIEPSSKGTAGASLDVEPVLVSVNRFGLPDLRRLEDLAVAAYSDAACTVPAPGTVVVKDFGLLTYVGVALYTRLSDTAAGKTYFKFSARNVKSICSRLVTISAAAADHLVLAGGDAQSGAPDSTLPVKASAKVLDKFGNAVSGTKIAFKANTGGGSVSPAEATSDANGIAASVLKLGPASGPNSFVAGRAGTRLPGQPATLTFSATASGGNPAPVPTRLGLSGPSSPGAGACSALSVTLLDANGQPIVSAASRAIALSGLGSGALFAGSSCATPVSELSIAAGSSQLTVYFKDTRAEALALQASSEGLQASASLALAVQPGAAAKLGFAAQPSQAAIAGQALALQPSVRILDAYGNAVGAGSHSVALSTAEDAACESASEDSGLSAAANPMASASGTAGFAGLSLARAGIYHLRASADGLSPSCSQPIAVQAAAPSVISVLSGAGQTGAVGAQLAAPLEVQVADAFGNAVSGAALAFAASAGSISPSSALSDSNGRAQALVTLPGAPVSLTLRFSAVNSGIAWAQAADALPSVSAPATAIAGPAATLSLSGPSALQAGGCSQAYTVRLIDAFGNPAQAAAALSIPLSGQGHGAVYVDPDCSQPLSLLVIAEGAGSQDFHLSNAVAEELVLRADGSAASLGESHLSLSVSPGPASKLVFTAQPSGATAAGASFAAQPAFAVQDAYGNLVIDASGQVSLGAYSDPSCSAVAGGSLQASSNPVALSGGRASFAGVSYSIAGALHLGASVAGLPSICSAPLAITAAAPAAVLLSGPISKVAGSCAGPFAVSLRDAYGNAAVATDGLLISLSGAGNGSFYSDPACAAAVSAAPFATGASSASVYFGDTRSESLLLTVGGVGAGALWPFTVQAGAASRLAFATQPSGTSLAGGALAVQPQVAIEDAFGNRVGTGAPVALAAYADALCALPASALLGVAANPVEAFQGLASFAELSYALMGTIHIGASSGGLTSACSSQVAILAAQASAIAVAQGDGQSATVGTTLTLSPTVKVTDAYGNPVFGAQVTFAVGTGGGSASLSGAATDAAGLASTGFTLGSAAGANTLVATIASGASVTFHATGTPRLPASLLLTGPFALTAGVCSQAFTVQLMDGTHTATVSQAETVISLSGASHGAFFSDPGCSSPVGSATIPAGSGTAQFFVGDTQVESLTLVAQSSGLGSSSASAAVSAGAASRLVFSAQPSIAVIAGQALAAQPIVSAQDAYGNFAPSFTGAVTLSATSDAACSSAAAGAFSASSNPLTAGAGTASFGGVSYGIPGLIYLKASASGLSPACSQQVTVSAALTLAAGTAHTCALNNGNVKCWGFNSAGSLGNGTNSNASTPQQVTGLASGVIAMGAGGQHGCASTASGLYCWGLNVAGQLGNGSVANSNVPVAVPGIAGGVSQIVGGDSHTCILNNGAVQCWGDNTFGQLGKGSAGSSSAPAAVQGLPGPAVSIAAASNSSCAVLADGTAYCWGYNDYGQLGNGSTANGFSPVQVQGLPGSVTSIAPGIENTCALVNGSVYCWGRNDSGQLGNGSFASTMLPTQVQGFGTHVTTLLSGGQNFSCAILETGAVQCWGQNTRGQLGDNRASGSQSTLPVQVSGLTSGYQSLHAGYIHACASDGAHVKCWGWGSSGQLGNGQTVQSNVPVAVVGY